jgi:hypothetical protein
MSSWARLLRGVSGFAGCRACSRRGAQCILRLGVRWRRHAGQVEVADPTTRVGWALQQAGDAAKGVGLGYGSAGLTRRWSRQGSKMVVVGLSKRAGEAFAVPGRVAAESPQQHADRV